MIQTHYYALSQVGADPASSHSCKKRLRIISRLSNRWRLILLGTTLALFAVVVTYLGFALWYLITVLQKANELPDRSESHYNLYKNTRFEACMLNPYPQVDCTALTEEPANSSNGGDYNGWLNYPGNWCEVASCFSGWKIVPSTPRDSAFSLTYLFIWIQLCLTAISVLWELYKTLSSPDECKGPGPFDWFFLMKDIVTLGFWVAGFKSLLVDISFSSPLSLVAWISICNLWIGLHFHPWSCWSVLVNRPILKRIVFWTLSVVVLFHWAATTYAFRVYWDFYHYGAYLSGQATEKYNIRKYDCLEEDILSAPGVSSCSAKTLCAKNAFFTSPDFYVNWQMRRMLDVYSILSLISLILYPVCIAAMVSLLSLHRWAPGLIKGPVRRGWLPKRKSAGEWVASFQLLLTFFFAQAGVVLGMFILARRFLFHDLDRIQQGGEGTIVWHPGCTAVHVGISPEWSYLDLQENRWLRIVKMWFNA